MRVGKKRTGLESERKRGRGRRKVGVFKFLDQLCGCIVCVRKSRLWKVFKPTYNEWPVKQDGKASWCWGREWRRARYRSERCCFFSHTHTGSSFLSLHTYTHMSWTLTRKSACFLSTLPSALLNPHIHTSIELKTLSILQQVFPYTQLLLMLFYKVLS